MKRVLITPLILLVGVTIGLGVVLYFDKHSIKLINKPKEFPHFNLPNLHDKDEILSQDVLHGDIALVNIFASWCLVCRIEHDLFAKLKKEDYIKIYGIDWKDEKEEVNQWLSDLGNPYEKVIYDYKGELVTALGATGVPETYIINRKGNIIYSYAGAITEDIFEEEIKPIIERERKK